MDLRSSTGTAPNALQKDLQSAARAARAMGNAAEMAERKEPKGRHPPEEKEALERDRREGSTGKPRFNPGARMGANPGEKILPLEGGGSCLPSLDVWATSEGSDSREDESPAFAPR